MIISSCMIEAFREARLLKSSFLTLFSIFLFECNSDPIESVIDGKTMGTTYSIHIVESNQSKYKIQFIKTKIDSTLHLINQQMSTYISDSEITKFNKRRTLNYEQISSNMLEVIKKSVEIYKITEKAFDVTIHKLVKLWGFGNEENRIIPPSHEEITRLLDKTGFHNIQIREDGLIAKSKAEVEIDLSAIAKGFAVDSVIDLLLSLGYKNIMVEIGGEVSCKGHNLNGDKWNIGIEYPINEFSPKQKLLNIVQISSGSMATSGDYRNFFEFNGRRFSHTINPETGYPVENDLVSVTVISDLCMDADAYATAIMVMGKNKGLDLIESLNNTECYLVEIDGSGGMDIYQSSGFVKFLKDIR